MANNQDQHQQGIHATSAVPLTDRKSAFTMTLLWITMVASFPAVIAGFEWYYSGITLTQLFSCGAISILLLLLYSIPACELGARTGLGYAVLGQLVFGRSGGAFLTLNLLWLFTAWYALTAVLMAQAVMNLFHLKVQLIWLSVLFSIVMATNNFFGFKGIANFARYFAAPTLILWVVSVLWKTLHEPEHHLVNVPHPDYMSALNIISAFIIGFAVWGNEQDYWRYSKPGILRSAIPLSLSIAIGQIIFPLTGWFIARANVGSGYASTFAFMSDYCFGGIAIIGLLILSADYFATNDSSLFGSATAIKSFVDLKHSWAVAFLTFVGALLSALLSVIDMDSSLKTMVSLNSIILPTPTIIMIAEWWLRVKVFAQTEPFKFSELRQLPRVYVPAMVSLSIGLVIGVMTAGVIPNLEFCQIGISPLNAWLSSLLVYIPLRLYSYNKNKKDLS